MCHHSSSVEIGYSSGVGCLVLFHKRTRDRFTFVIGGQKESVSRFHLVQISKRSFITVDERKVLVFSDYAVTIRYIPLLAGKRQLFMNNHNLWEPGGFDWKKSRIIQSRSTKTTHRIIEIHRVLATVTTTVKLPTAARWMCSWTWADIKEGAFYWSTSDVWSIEKDNQPLERTPRWCGRRIRRECIQAKVRPCSEGELPRRLCLTESMIYQHSNEFS